MIPRCWATLVSCCVTYLALIGLVPQLVVGLFVVSFSEQA